MCCMIVWCYARELSIIALGEMDIICRNRSKNGIRNVRRSGTKSKRLNLFWSWVEELLGLNLLGTWLRSILIRRLESVREDLSLYQLYRELTKRS